MRSLSVLRWPRKAEHDLASPVSLTQRGPNVDKAVKAALDRHHAKANAGFVINPGMIAGPLLDIATDVKVAQKIAEEATQQVQQLLIVAVVLLATWPIIANAMAVLQDAFMKMGPRRVEAALDKHPLWGAVPAPQRDTRCERGTKGWDDICTFVYSVSQGPGNTLSLNRLKVGVRVGSRTINYVSPPHELNAVYIQP